MLIDVSACCPEHANAAIDDLFAKAAGDPPDDSIWNPHESPYLTKLVELFTERGLTRIGGIQAELAKWLDHSKHKPGALPPKPGMVAHWTPGELALTRLYLETLPPERFTLDDWMMVVDYLVHRYMSPESMIDEAQWLASRASMMGRVQARMEALTAAQAATVLSALPATVPATAAAFGLSAAQSAMLEYGRVRCAENVVSLSDELRHALRRVVMDYQRAEALGDPSLRESLQTRLHDLFSSANRDWRRIAVTEAGENANQGLIASLPAGARVRRLEQYANACPWCRKIHGREMVVVPADHPEKDGDTMVWPGKTNIGRSAAPRKRTAEGLVDRLPSERWWIAAGTQHPHCRGTWLRLTDIDRAGDAKFSAWLDATLAKA